MAAADEALAPPIQALIDGQPGSALPLDDRGLLYADGVFETLRFQSGHGALWPWHRERLKTSCVRLNLLPGDGPARDQLADTLLAECRQLAGDDDCVLRIVITRGRAVKPGYGYTGAERLTRVVMRLPAPPARAALTVGYCEHTLPEPGPAAGLKHLSRLDQVLLAREASQAGWDEGLVFDRRDHLCEAVQANVVLQLADSPQWLTPPIGAGVAGTARAALLALGLVHEAPVSRSQLTDCRGMGLCNGVRGLEPVAHLVDVGRLEVEPLRELRHAFINALAHFDSTSQRRGEAQPPVGPLTT